MESYAELSYMETSLQLLQIKDEIEGLHKQKEVIENLIKKKLREQSELMQKNLRFIKIVKKASGGSEHYSPKKRGISPPTPKKSDYASNHVPPATNTTPNLASSINGKDSLVAQDNEMTDEEILEIANNSDNKQSRYADHLIDGKKVLTEKAKSIAQASKLVNDDQKRSLSNKNNGKTSTDKIDAGTKQNKIMKPSTLAKESASDASNNGSGSDENDSEITHNITGNNSNTPQISEKGKNTEKENGNNQNQCEVKMEIGAHEYKEKDKNLENNVKRKIFPAK